jgi:cytochrome c oxidase assembly factor CtaG/cytochrome c2
MRRAHLGIFVAIGTLVAAPFALAHEINEAGIHDAHELVRAWSFEPGVMIPLVLSAWLYARGLLRTWRGSGVGHGIRRWEAGCFAGGWLALVVALVSPLHPWGRELFSAHMTQHEILMLVAAPLLVLGRPMIAFLRALPPTWAAGLARFSNQRTWSVFWRAIANSFSAWLIHAIVLWLWHVPALFQATITNEFVHALQHTSFLGSALLFWWAVMHERSRAIGYGMAVLYMFTTALHSGLLGVLIAFAGSVWYPAYAHTAPNWGLTALEDQQLGGLIMWIPAGVVYIVAGLALMAGYMRESGRRVRRAIEIPSPVAAASVVLLMMVMTGCDSPDEQRAAAATGGDPHRGRTAVRMYGCSSCHTIPGVREANGLVGPPLTAIGSRVYLGGVIENSPQNMIRWIQNPKAIDQKTAMPNLHLSESDARDITAYLYTLR